MKTLLPPNTIPLPGPAPTTPAQDELTVLLSKQKYPEAFASMRKELPLTCSDEEIVKFLLSSNGYSKYDALSLTEKKWVANHISNKTVNIVDTIPKSSTPPTVTVNIADVERGIEENKEKIRLFTLLLGKFKAKLPTLEESGKKTTYQEYIERLEGLIEAGNKTLERLLSEGKMTGKNPS
ncbi:MAG: hypothetical protein JSR85_05555 [Proteobacteria bacterium]|nr:hypothetical protein [Pseudomonadota bacterium]